MPERLRNRALAIALGGALLVSACGAEASTPAAVGVAPAPGAASDGEAPGTQALLSGEFTTTSGATIDLASLEGQDVVLWFWAPW